MTMRLVVGIAIGALMVAGWSLVNRLPQPRLPHPTLHQDEVVTAADYAALEQYHGRVTPAEVEAAMAFVNPYRTLSPFVGIEPDAAVLFDSAAHQAEMARIRWREPDAPLPALKKRTLAGLRILLDPGHFGGAFAEDEHRHFIFAGRDPVREGDLNWGAVKVLERKLERAGAEVILARGPPPEEALPAVAPDSPILDADEPMLAWLETHGGYLRTVQWFRDEPARLTRFRISAAGALRAPEASVAKSFFNAFARMDYRRRGLMAEAVESDLLISLHHNISGHPRVNRLVVFLPGFIRWDSDNEPGRYFTFRRLLEGDTPLLIRLAYDVSRSMQRELGVRADQYVRKPDFNKLPVFPGNGVFARNLGVLRRATGPALLIEGPCMNHLGENLKLLEQDFQIDGKWYPERVRQFAQSVFSAVEANAGALWRQKMRRGRE